jgi:hypothetical protein
MYKNMKYGHLVLTNDVCLMVQKMGKELEYQMRDIDFDQKSE